MEYKTEEVKPRAITNKAIKDPMEDENPKLLEIMLIIEPMVMIEAFPRQYIARRIRNNG